MPANRTVWCSGRNETGWGVSCDVVQSRGVHIAMDGRGFKRIRGVFNMPLSDSDGGDTASYELRGLYPAVVQYTTNNIKIYETNP